MLTCNIIYLLFKVCHTIERERRIEKWRKWNDKNFQQQFLYLLAVVTVTIVLCNICVVGVLCCRRCENMERYKTAKYLTLAWIASIFMVFFHRIYKSSSNKCLKVHSDLLGIFKDFRTLESTERFIFSSKWNWFNVFHIFLYPFLLAASSQREASTSVSTLMLSTNREKALIDHFSTLCE